MKISAKYMDGQQAKSHEIELERAGGELQFKVESKPFSWQIIQCKKQSLANGLSIVKHAAEGQVEVETKLLKKLAPAFFKVDLPKLIQQNKVVAILLFIMGLGVYGLFLGVTYFRNELNAFIVEKIPERSEYEIGQNALNDYLMEEYQMPETSDNLNEFAQLIGLHNEVELIAIDKPDFNAFSFPGGFIVIHSGTLEALENEEELIALIGHEWGHIKERHGLKGVVQEMALKIALKTLIGADAGNGVLFTEGLSWLSGLEYSRELEKEADQHAILLLKNNGFGPSGALGLMQKLQQNEASTQAPEFLSTHPLSENRLKEMEAAIQEHETRFSVRDSSLIWSFKKLKATL